MSGLKNHVFDWQRAIYRDITKIFLKDDTIPLINQLTTIIYVDTNLFHDIVTSKSMIGILHLNNKTLID